MSAPQDSQLYPLGGDLALAGKLTAGHTARVVVYTFDNHPYTDGFNRALREQLAAIGLRTTIRRMTNDDFGNGSLARKATTSDLIWGGLNAETSDPVTYLQQLFLPAADRSALKRIAALRSPRREKQAAALARKIERQSLFAVYNIGANRSSSPRASGCIRVNRPGRRR